MFTFGVLPFIKQMHMKITESGLLLFYSQYVTSTMPCAMVDINTNVPLFSQYSSYSIIRANTKNMYFVEIRISFVCTLIYRRNT